MKSGVRSLTLTAVLAASGAMCVPMMCLSASAQMNGHSAAAQAVNNPNQNGMGAMAGSENADATFLKEAAAANMAEVSAAQLALSKSTNDDVKKFAQQMVDDHTAMQKDVAADAAAMNVTLPTEPMKSDRMEAAKLKTLDGAAFDKAYISAQVKDHKKVLAKMKAENASTQNAQLKDLTSKGSAKVADHLKMAQDLQSKLG